MKGEYITVWEAIILVVIIVVALAALIYVWVSGFFTFNKPEKPIDAAIFCQGQQYDDYENSYQVTCFDESGKPFTETIDNPGGANSYLHDEMKQFYCINNIVTISKIITQNFTTGHYFEEWVYEDPACPMSYELYCPKKLKWGIECSNVDPKWLKWAEEEWNATENEVMNMCGDCKTQKFYWDGKDFVRRGE